MTFLVVTEGGEGEREITAENINQP